MNRNMIARFSTSCRNLRPFLPERLKGGKVEKFGAQFGNYLKNILNDYVTVAKETWSDMKDRPIKAAFYISLLTGAGVLMKTNPSEQEFQCRLTESNMDLMLVSDLVRNPSSEHEIATLSKQNVNGQLKYFNLGLVSLMCRREHSSELGLYIAKCKYVKPHWMEWHKTIVDVGVFGKWRNLEKKMTDYDVNPEEWMADGQPNLEFEFYKKSLVSWDMKIE